MLIFICVESKKKCAGSYG